MVGWLWLWWLLVAVAVVVLWLWLWWWWWWRWLCGGGGWWWWLVVVVVVVGGGGGGGGGGCVVVVVGGGGGGGGVVVVVVVVGGVVVVVVELALSLGHSAMNIVRARFKKVAISARVVNRSGQNRAGLTSHPRVMPLAARASMFNKWLLPAMSTNPPAPIDGSNANALAKKLAVSARVVNRCGQNRAGLTAHPRVIPFTANASTCGDHHCDPSTSTNDDAPGSLISNPITRASQIAVVQRSIG